MSCCDAALHGAVVVILASNHPPTHSLDQVVNETNASAAFNISAANTAGSDRTQKKNIGLASILVSREYNLIAIISVLVRCPSGRPFSETYIHTHVHAHILACQATVALFPFTFPGDVTFGCPDLICKKVDK